MNLGQIVSTLIDFINGLVAVLASIALVIFLWGGVRFIYRAGDARGNAADKAMLTWGLVSLFVLVSVMGIVKLLQESFLP